MSKFLESKSIYYKDVNLIAQPQSNIFSRKQIPKNLDKIIVAPMSSIVGERFAIQALNLGLSVCLPRFNTIQEQLELVKKIYKEAGNEEDRPGSNKLWLSVGLNDSERARIINHPYVLVDVANGYLWAVVGFAKQLQKAGYRVMCGNVHSAKGFNLYQDCYIRVGIGNGAVCQTKDITGYNRGQITEIKDCLDNRYSVDQKIVADGGISSIGNACKAFACGADFVMMGSYFKNAEESLNVINGEYKYWGGASEKQQIAQYGQIKRSPEGKEIDIDKNSIKPLNILAKELWGGIASAISYSGKANLTQFIGEGIFERKV